MLPRHTTLVPGPARVTSVFICLGVRFCASSMMSHLLTKVRPRMKLSDLILILDLTRSRVAAPPHSPPDSLGVVETVGLSSGAPIQGCLFSSSVPGRNP